MKSRLAVSVLFTLVAATFTPDATVAFGKLRSRAERLRGCGVIRGHHALTSRDSEGMATAQPCDTDAGMMIHFDASMPFRPDCVQGDQPRTVGAVSPKDKNVELLATASKILEVLDLMHIK